MNTIMRCSGGGRCRSRLVLGLALLLFGAPADAAQPDECPLLVPDLRCDRDGRYEGFIPTMAFPYLFEDPFITTGVSAHFIRHEFPGRSVFRGGEAWVIAVQARLAITDRLAFIATKDGWTRLKPDASLIRDGQGWMNISGGFKYALIDRPDLPFILTPSIRFELTQGSPKIFSGHGEGQVIPAVSLAWGIGLFHLIGDICGRVPFDSQDQSTSIFYNVQADFALHRWLVPFVSWNGIEYVDNGVGNLPVRLEGGGSLPLATAQQALGTGSFEGVDILNLGSPGVEGEHYATVAVGVRVPFTKRISAGFAYERPVLNRKEITKDRMTLNLVFEL